MQCCSEPGWTILDLNNTYSLHRSQAASQSVYFFLQLGHAVGNSKMLIFSFSQQNLQFSDQLDRGFPMKRPQSCPHCLLFADQRISSSKSASKLGLSQSGCSCLIQSRVLFCIFHQEDCTGLASSAASSPLQVKGWLRRVPCWAQISLQVQEYMRSLSQCTEKSYSGYHGWVNTRQSILPRLSQRETAQI